jgi:hypothetical protein
MRWDLTTPFHERQNKIVSFNPGAANPAAGGILGALYYWGTGPGKNGLTRIGQPYLRAWGPKVGLAYAFTPKTIGRASFGVSYYAYWFKFIHSTGSWVPSYGYQYTCQLPLPTTLLTPTLNWDNGPAACSYPQLPIINPSLLNNQGVNYIDQNDNRPPMIENVGAEVERELPGHVGLRVSYVGTFGHREYGSYGMNELPLQYLSLGNLLSLPYNSPQAIAAGIHSPYPGFSGSVAQALRPYPQYGGVTDFYAQAGSSNYNALQVNVQRHFGSFTFLGNFTWSQFLTKSDDPGFGQTQLYMKWQNSHSPYRNQVKSLAGFNDNGTGGNFPKYANLNWVWDVPVGRGKHWLHNTNRLADELLGNWRASAFQHYASAPPLTLQSGDSIPGMSPTPFPGGIWPIRNLGVPVLAPGVHGCGDVHPGIPGKNLYYNPAAFQHAGTITSGSTTTYIFGNTFQVDNARGCPYFQEDFAVDKIFPFHEGKWIDVGVMANNLFNRHTFISFQPNINNGAFGQFGGATFPRSIQLTAKIVF